MYEYVNKQGLMYDFQSGFRKTYSTDSGLLYLTDFIRKEIDEGNLCGMVLLDLQKAFDTVNYCLLISKLEALGLSSIPLGWVKSYLSGREQVVEVNGSLSQAKPMICGVLQGSVLGPLRFLLYINDMKHACFCSLFLYADDSTLLVSHKSKTVLESIFSTKLSNINKRLGGNKLSLHLGKTEAIIFGSRPKLCRSSEIRVELGGEVLTTKTSVSYLGCILDGSLGGVSMANEVLGKVNARTMFLSRKSKLLDKDSMKVLATALIQCHFDFASTSWFGGLSRLMKGKLQIAQNKLIRVVLKVSPRTHIGRSCFQELNWLPVEARVSQIGLGLVYRSIYGHAPRYLSDDFPRVRDVHNHSTRSGVADMCLYRFRSNAGASEWNELPLPIKTTSSLGSFKNKVKICLMSSVPI
uniref:Reverse transcriptase domain-containing protein n=1 Tax=Oncorhynchus mykiss TaxID=8022 RepID=A0A8C7QXU9_ONCMY